MANKICVLYEMKMVILLLNVQMRCSLQWSTKFVFRIVKPELDSQTAIVPFVFLHMKRQPRPCSNVVMIAYEPECDSATLQPNCINYL